LVLGNLLLVQTAAGVALVLFSGEFSFRALGVQRDDDLVKLTAGLTAVKIAWIPKRKVTTSL
jgi:hypothetical protein